MQKLIRILAIVACVLVALSVFAMVVCMPFNTLLGSLLVHSEDILSAMPLTHWPSLVNGLLLFGCTALLIVCCGNKRGGIWLELLVIVAVAVVMPLVSQGLNLWVNRLVNTRGECYAAAYSVSAALANYCMAFARVGSSLAFVVAGMSILFKHMSKER